MIEAVEVSASFNWFLQGEFQEKNITVQLPKMQYGHILFILWRYPEESSFCWGEWSKIACVLRCFSKHY